MFAVLQGESNKVIRELWTLVKNALNDISANVGQEEEYQAKPMMNNNEMPPEKQDGEEHLKNKIYTFTFIFISNRKFSFHSC